MQSHTFYALTWHHDSVEPPRPSPRHTRMYPSLEEVVPHQLRLWRQHKYGRLPRVIKITLPAGKPSSGGVPLEWVSWQSINGDELNTLRTLQERDPTFKEWSRRRQELSSLESLQTRKEAELEQWWETVRLPAEE